MTDTAETDTADFDAIAPKVAKLVRLLASDSDGEVLAAARQMTRTLSSHKLDIHALAERVEHGLPEAGMRKIWNQAEAYGRQCVEAERAAAAPEPNGIFTSVNHVDSGINGYSWQQIAEHCARNRHLFSGKSLEFVDSIPEKLARFGSPTPKQADWLRDLFVTRCGGRIG